LASIAGARVCFVGHGATLEGAGRYLLDQAGYLADRRATVFAILPRHGPLADRLSERGVAVRYAPNPWWARPVNLTEDHLAHTARAARLMADIVLQLKVDVVYTQTIVAPTGAIAAALAGIPHVWHIHEFAFNPGAIEMSVPKHELADLMLQTSNIIVFNSRAVEREWAGMFPSTRTAIAYNWVAPFEMSSELSQELPGLGAADSYLITIVGSIQRWKRQLDAVRAVALLRRRGVPARLLVIGPFVERDYQAEIESFVRENGLSDHVQLLGFVDQPARIVSRAHVNVLCSDREPFGRVTIESMALGVPVIATNSGGTPEIIEDGESAGGILFETGNVEALADSLERLWRDHTLRTRLAAAAKRRAALFSSADIAMAPVVEAIQALIGKRNPAWPLGNVLRTSIAAAREGPDDGVGPSSRLARMTSVIRRLTSAGASLVARASREA